MDLNTITEGTYVLVANRWDQILSKPGQPFDFVRHRKGDILELDIEDARRLFVARAVVPYDPDAPAYEFAADGSLVALPPADAGSAEDAALNDGRLAGLRERLGLSPDATAEEITDTLEAAANQLDLAAQSIDQRAAELEQAQQQTEDATAETVVDHGRPESDRIEDIVTWVGGDAERAAIALEGERSTKGDNARPKLVATLEEIITNPGGS